MASSLFYSESEDKRKDTSPTRSSVSTYERMQTYREVGERSTPSRLQDYSTSLKLVKARKIFYEFNANNVILQNGPHKVGTRIKISYNDDDDEYPLIIASHKMFFSFGVQEDIYSNKPSGTYSMCIVINESTDENSKEYKFVKMIKDLEERCLKRIEKKNKDFTHFSRVIKRYDATHNRGATYRIYPKLIITKETSKIWSRFFTVSTDENENFVKTIDPMELKNKRCYVCPALLFDSLYFYQGGVSLQCKISEAFVKLIEMDDNQEMCLDLSKLEI